MAGGGAGHGGGLGLGFGREVGRDRLRDLEFVRCVGVTWRGGRVPVVAGCVLGGTRFTRSGQRGFHA